MRRKYFFLNLLFISCIFMFIAVSAFSAEDITLITYYPSPYGMYKQLGTKSLGVGDNDIDGDFDAGDIPTASGEVWFAGDVGIGTTTPAGKLDVNGAIYQRGAMLHADYVFTPDYEMESIEEHTAYMWREKHLKAVPGTKLDESGQEMLEIGAHRKGILEELEKAHVYIDQLNERMKVLEVTLKGLGG